jgi:hypothetical protein
MLGFSCLVCVAELLVGSLLTKLAQGCASCGSNSLVAWMMFSIVSQD